MPYLAERFTVIAPDLAGHGESAKPRGDYSLGAHASSLRDLLLALGHERATFVGHSLGGGIAMQFSYQFPERCERLVLVDSGGLGRDVSWLLRAATLPGSELVLPLLAATRLLDAGARAGGLLNRLGLGLGTDLEEMARGHSTLSDSAARAAFVHTLRSVVEPGGQRVDASNRLYLAEHLPFLLIWGERDSIIPSPTDLRPTSGCPTVAWRCSRVQATFPSSTSPSASSRCSWSSSTQPSRPRGRGRFRGLSRPASRLRLGF